MKELVIPEAAVKGDNAQEFIRFWISDGVEHVALNIGAMGEHEARQWGMILADLSIHIIQAMQQEGAKSSPVQLREEIEGAYRKRLKAKHVMHAGTTHSTKH